MNDAGAGRTSEERPNEFADEPPEEIAPLDETPDGHTPAESTDGSDDSLPPGAG